MITSIEVRREIRDFLNDHSMSEPDKRIFVDRVTKKINEIILKEEQLMLYGDPDSIMPKGIL